MRPVLLAALALTLMAPSGHARAPDAPEAGKVDAEASVEPAAPASMRRHGVIGHVVPPAGISILDADTLSGMRDRLILFIRTQGE